MPTYIVFIGPPGVGKGTQAELVAERTGLPHISSGDLFRENIKNQTQLGKEAQSYMTKGELVPDSITISMVHDRLKKDDCANGALLDGFPRTPKQADELEAILETLGGKVDFVPFIFAQDQVLIDRLSGRLVCRENGHVFHVKNNPPKEGGVCDFDGSELYTRDDDQVETIKHRIQVYLDQTMPLIEYYRNKNILVDIDGSREIETVTEDILKAIGFVE
ncbi:MAG: adenylate kinase [Anaerolineales bacterium]